MSLTSANQVETNKYELTVSVNKEQFENAINQVYRKNVKQISIPGFRKGKAPRKTIERLYGEGFFYEEAVNLLYPEMYDEAVKEAGVVPVSQPDVEIEQVSEEGFTFKATVFVRPEIEVKNYKGIAVDKVVKEASEQDVAEELAKMQDKNGRLVSVEGRPAADGDVTVIDFDGYVDDKPFEGGKAEAYTLTLGSGQFIPGFEEQIVGHNVDDEFDVNVEFPAEYHAEELAGKPAVFKVKLHEIKNRELPELDDEFAKDVSEFDTLEELKADLLKKAQERFDTQADNAVEDTLIKTVIENVEGEIPEVMFQNRATEMVKDFDYRLRVQGMDLQTYLQYTGMSLEAFTNTYIEQAANQVKLRLALEKIAEVEKLEATEEEIAKAYEDMAAQYKMEIDKVKEIVREEDVRKDVLVDKAVEVVRENAVITETKEEPKAEQAAEEAEAKPAPKKRGRPAKKKEAPAEEAAPAEQAEASEAEQDQ